MRDATGSAHSWQSGSAGLVVSDVPHTAVLFTSGVHSIARFGHARWVSDAQVDKNLKSICQRFLEAYRVRKVAALKSLFGDFPLVVIDTIADEAMLAIDRFGIQTMAYQADARGLIFGTNCDVVGRHPNANSEIDPQAIYNYAFFQVVPGRRTIYRGQNRLLPGHCLTWARGWVPIQSYWAMNFSEQQGSAADFKPRFRETLKMAVASVVGDANTRQRITSTRCTMGFLKRTNVAIFTNRTI
jgi:asparagine synthetase B (glutamine-hydrolysing)